MNPPDHIEPIADPLTILAQILDRAPEVRFDMQKQGRSIHLHLRTFGDGTLLGRTHAAIAVDCDARLRVDPVVHGLESLLRQVHQQVVR